MKNYQSWVEVFTIFSKYDSEGSHVVPDHDEMWAGPDPAIVLEEDKSRLKELGWEPCSENCFHISL